MTTKNRVKISVETLDLIVGLAIMLLSAMVIFLLLWFYTVFLIVGLHLMTGDIRSFYNKKLKSYKYWHNQRKLWRETK